MLTLTGLGGGLGVGKAQRVTANGFRVEVGDPRETRGVAVQARRSGQIKTGGGEHKEGESLAGLSRLQQRNENVFEKNTHRSPGRNDDIPSTFSLAAFYSSRKMLVRNKRVVFRRFVRAIRCRVWNILYIYMHACISVLDERVCRLINIIPCKTSTASGGGVDERERDLYVRQAGGV